MNFLKPGFHVIELKRFEEVKIFPIKPERTSILNFLRDLSHGQIDKFIIVTGLDGLLKTSTEEAIIQLRRQLGKNITNILALKSSIVFSVSCKITNVPDNPRIYSKSLSLFFPRPHDINLMEPGYLYYPVF